MSTLWKLHIVLGLCAQLKLFFCLCALCALNSPVSMKMKGRENKIKEDLYKAARKVYVLIITCLLFVHMCFLQFFNNAGLSREFKRKLKMSSGNFIGNMLLFSCMVLKCNNNNVSIKYWMRPLMWAIWFKVVGWFAPWLGFYCLTVTREKVCFSSLCSSCVYANGVPFLHRGQPCWSLSSSLAFTVHVCSSFILVCA